VYRGSMEMSGQRLGRVLGLFFGILASLDLPPSLPESPRPQPRHAYRRRLHFPECLVSRLRADSTDMSRRSLSRVHNWFPTSDLLIPAPLAFQEGSKSPNDSSLACTPPASALIRVASVPGLLPVTWRSVFKIPPRFTAGNMEKRV